MIMTRMNGNERQRFSPTMWIVLGVVLVVFWVVTGPRVIRSERKLGRTEAIRNARQLVIALFDFETEYGRYPDESTAAKIRQKSAGWTNLGNSSANDYFRQLIAAGIVKDESIFYAQTAYTTKPDKRIEPVDKALAPGEVGFGYLMDGKVAFSTEGNPARPLACSPMAFDGKSVSNQIFDPSIHDGKVVILRMDNSVNTMRIDPTTHRVILGGSKSLLDTGEDTVWGVSAKPVIVPPLPKP